MIDMILVKIIVEPITWFVNLLNDNQGFVMIILTSAYSYFTYRMLKCNEVTIEEMKEQRLQDLTITQKQNAIERISKFNSVTREYSGFLLNAFSDTKYLGYINQMVNQNTQLKFNEDELNNFKKEGLYKDYYDLFESDIEEKIKFINNISINKVLAREFDSETDKIVRELVVSKWQMTKEQHNILKDKSPNYKSLEFKAELTDKLYLQYICEVREAEMALINDIEEFALYYNSELADNDLMTNSLRDTFVSATKIIYPTISTINTDKFDLNIFPNTIILFNKWNQEIIRKSENQ